MMNTISSHFLGQVPVDTENPLKLALIIYWVRTSPVLILGNRFIGSISKYTYSNCYT